MRKLARWWKSSSTRWEPRARPLRTAPSWRSPAASAAAAALLAAGAAAGCAPGRAPPLRVFAAASLEQAFTEMAAAHEAGGGPRVELNFAASSTLAAQIVSHGGAGVFASADPPTMERVRNEGLVEGEVRALALSAMQIAVPAGNPGGITGLAGLGAPGLKVVLAAPEVPAGRYASEILARAGVEVKPVSFEMDVRAVLAKVSLGEADAGIVYETDVAAAGSRVAGVAIPAELNVEAAYQIAVIRNSASGGPAGFAAFATGPEGRAILARHGFRLPAPPR